jgi:hypothetical protein
MDPSRDSTTDDHTYTVTTYVAAPGTPIANPQTGRVGGESLPGHMYYMISDSHDKNGYGFAPTGHGRPLGPGEVSPNDFERYQDPAYARTIEITREQYEKLKEFGEAGLKGQDTYFDLRYNGANNSCIDFTWGALNHAGLHQQLALPNNQSLPLRDADGQVLPLRNIAALKTIPDPMPDSPYNRDIYRDLPDGPLDKARHAKDGLADKLQQGVEALLDKAKCAAFPKLPDCQPDGASLDPKRVLPNPHDPASRDHPMYKQIEEGVSRIDVGKGRTFDQRSENLTMSALADAKAAGIVSADHVVLNEAGRKPNNDGSLTPANTFLIVIQGSDPYDPAAKRAITDVAQAVERPVELSLQKVDALNQHQAQILAQQQTPSTQDDPNRGPRTM